MPTKTFRHPVVGEVTVDCDSLTLTDRDQHLVLCTTPQGSRSAEAVGPVQYTVSTQATTVQAYDEFGNPIDTTAPTTYGWLGGKQRATDAATGLTLMGARLYNPATGRFLQTDPVQGGNANAYDYVDQNPLTNFDLNGEMCWSRHCWLTNLFKIAVFVAVAALDGFLSALCDDVTGGACGVINGRIFRVVWAMGDAAIATWNQGNNTFNSYLENIAWAGLAALISAGVSRYFEKRPAVVRRLRIDITLVAQRLSQALRRYI